MNTVLAPDVRDAVLQELHARTTSPGFHFLSADHLTRLHTFEADGAPVVSLYLPLTPEMRRGEAWYVQFKDLARSATQGATDKAQQQTIQAALDRMEAALRGGLPRTGRGVVFFDCAAQGLREQIGVPLDVPARVVVGPRPYVRPLARLRDEHDRFGLVLMTSRKARFFFAQIGLVEEVLGLDNDDVGTWDTLPRDAVRDKRDQAAQGFAKRVAHAFGLLAQALDVRHLLYAAPPDLEGAFLDGLDQPTRQRIAGSFAAEITASTAEVAARAETVQRGVEAQEELDTLATIRDHLTGRAVVGVDDTLAALNEGRVRLLVVADSFYAEGGRGAESGLLTAHTSGAHPVTGEAVVTERYLGDAMLERALDQGAALELVRSDAALALLKPLGSVAALLRF